MLRKEIEKIYSDIIADYFNKGYYINMNTMNGSQLNEIAKIDLTNGKEVLRVMLCGSNTDRDNECHYDLHYISIVIGRNTDKLYNNHGDIIWNNHLEILSEQRFYEIGDRNDRRFFGTKEEALAARKKHYSRVKDVDYYGGCWVNISNNKAKSIVLSFVKRQYKCKSVTLKDIEAVKKYINRKGEVEYYVYARGKGYKMRNHKIYLTRDSF